MATTLPFILVVNTETSDKETWWRKLELQMKICEQFFEIEKTEFIYVYFC